MSRTAFRAALPAAPILPALDAPTPRPALSVPGPCLKNFKGIPPNAAMPYAVSAPRPQSLCRRSAWQKETAIAARASRKPSHCDMVATV